MSYFRRLNKALAFFLLLIFSAVQVIQCVHDHTEEMTSVSFQKEPAGTSKAQLQKLDVKCKVCDYVQNQQARHIHSSDQIALAVPDGKPLVLSVDFAASVFERSVHSWTNKGPPVV